MTQQQPDSDALRRQSWAHQENQRRQSRYHQAEQAWVQDARLLDWMLATTRTTIQSQPAPGSRGSRDETAYGRFPGCRLVDVKASAATYQAQPAGFSFHASRGLRDEVEADRRDRVAGADHLKIVGTGELVVSSRRVVFRGRPRDREWSVGKLVGVHHDAARPITLIQVSNRKRLSGFAYPSADAPRVRFLIELTAAAAASTVPVLLASLQTQRARHNQLRPRPPALATADEAPVLPAPAGSSLGRLLTGKPGQSRRRRILHTATAAGAALLVTGWGINALTSSPISATVSDPALPVATTAIPSPSVPSPPPSTAQLEPSSSPSAIPSPAEPSNSPSTTPAPVESPAVPTPTAPVTSPPAAPTPTIQPDKNIKKFKSGPRPTPPKLLSTSGPKVRYGAECKDGSYSDATGSGACSHHGGVRHWLLEDSAKVQKAKATNAKRKKAYKAALKEWTATDKQNAKKNSLLTKYPCSKSPYENGNSGYADWRDTNNDGVVLCRK